MTDQPGLLARAWELTQAIEHAAAMADWPAAARLAEERSPLLMSLSASQTPDSMATIRRIQAVDAAMMTNAKTAQRELHAELQAALRSTEAAGQYEQVAQL
ncbi:flagellar protein FliT [Paraburkholderia sp. RL17-383-BIF-A]|uniref:flagellar protein FliT n=1 Tax=Paraburkholderia sp. RL17-383-BIF-A TaxID=3031631 RepID=UPI0038BDA9EE